MPQSMPILIGSLAQMNTSTPVVSELASCPEASAIAPAPAKDSPIATTALATMPAAFARTYRPCWNVRSRYALRTAVMPSMRMVAVNSRMTGVASGTPDRCANEGATNQKPM